MKLSKTITAQMWREGHPVDLGFLPSDVYYARFCTSLLKKITQQFKKYDVPSEGNVDLALRLGHYVEDVVSKTHIFDSFRKIHTDMYGKKLPFYDLSASYLDDEVNVEDVKFLVWDHVQQLRGNEAIVNPDNIAIGIIAIELFPLICEGYEEAPEVSELHEFIFHPLNYASFIDAKKLLLWTMHSNSLTADPTVLGDIMDEVSELYKHHDIDLSPSLAFYSVTSAHLFSSPCKWLSVFAHEILSKMLEIDGMKEEARKLKATRHTGIKTFERIQCDETIVLLAECGKESEVTYRVRLDSFGDGIDRSKKFITTDLVSFDGEVWEINGSSWFSDNPADRPTTTMDGTAAYNYYLKVLNGKRIGYFKNYDEMRKQIVGNVSMSVSDEIRSNLEDSSAIMVFLNANGSLNVSPTLATTIPDPENPYFKGINRGDLLGSAFNVSMASADMARYFHEQGWYDGLGLSSSISSERGRQLFQDNFDFLLRYFRGAEYHTS